MVSNDTISYLEEKWAGKRRLSRGRAKSSELKYAVMCYYVALSGRWQPTRAIACVVFDKVGITELQKYATDVNGARSPTRQEVGAQDVIALVELLRAQTTRENLAAAIENRATLLGKEANSGPGFAFLPAEFNCNLHIPRFYSIEYIALERLRGSKEPLIRISSRRQYQIIDSADSNSTATRSIINTYPFQGCKATQERLKRSEYVLVYSDDIREVGNFQIHAPEWCIIALGPI
jgi:hypothetical protein